MENVKLISIELTNFKSFGHLQLADMEKSSLFAIVGMNGTGKSNIIDAFLYVLGENRAHNLRIRRYVDLIRVNAASAEGSTPAAKSCVVKLKLRKGTDTLLFERSTDSDGLSTYKMDGMTISFNQYLEDLRVIGANTAVQNYFILQGNIQDVASMSDKAMTIFLERISGSIEYKKEHERYMKLHSEAVEVVLRERATKNRLKKFERKARKQVEAHLKKTELEEKLEKHRVSLALFLSYQLSHEVANCNSVLEGKTREFETLKSQRNKLEAEIAQKPKKVADAQGVLQRANDKITRCEQDIERISNEVARWKQEFVAYASNTENIKKDIERLVKLQELCQTEYLRNQNLLKQTKENAKKVSESIEQSIVPNNEQMAEYSALVALAAQERRTGVTFQSASHTRIIKLRIELKEQRKKRIEKRLARILTTHDDYYAKCKELEEQLRELSVPDVEMTASVKKQNMKRDKIHKEIQKIQLDIDNVEYGEEPLDLEELKYRFPGVIARMCELLGLQSTRKRHQAAIMSKLSDNLQAIVVDNPNTAIRFGQYLNLTGFGDGRFLITSNVQIDRPLVHANIPHSELLTSLFEDGVAVNIVLRMDQDAIFVKDVEQARAISRELGRRINTVARNGRCYEQNGMVIVDLPVSKAKKCSKEAVKGMLKKKNDLIDSSFLCQRQIMKKSDEAKCRLKRLLTANTNRGKLEQIELELRKISMEKRQLEAELSQKEVEINELNNELNSIGEQSEVSKRITDEIFAGFCEKYGFSNVEQFKNSLENNRAKQVKELKSLQTKEGDLKKTLETIQEEITKHATAIIARQENIQQMQNYQQEVQSELQKNEKMHTEMVKKLRDLYAFKATRENPLKELRNEVLQLHTRKSEVDNAIEVLNEGIIATQIEIETVKGNLERHYQKCRSKNIVLPTISQGETEEYDYDQLPLALLTTMTKEIYEAKVQELKNELKSIEDEITRLGPIHPGAIEERDTFHREFLEAVRHLNESIATLTELEKNVQELHNQRTKRLNDCLRHLSDAVDRIYKELTHSQSACAQILATDPDAPYSGVISYMCAVPNKRYSRISNLSSGEKSMAALALFYALREYKPAPLFLLDEVDARLDPDNLLKLADFLHAHRGEGLQTFVITHKPQLANHADELMSVVESDAVEGNQLEQRIMRLELSDKF